MVKNRNRVVCLIMVIVIGFFMSAIAARILARQIVVRFGASPLTDLILFDAQALQGTASEEDRVSLINWSEEYPFDSDFDYHDRGDSASDSADFGRIVSIMSSVQGKIRPYINENLVGYFNIVQLSKWFERIIQWNYVSYNEYNGVIELYDGQLTSVQAYSDINDNAQNLIDFASLCKNEGIDFLYVQAPYKICKELDADICGTLDFSNQMADDFLNRMKGSQVNYIDCREELHNEKIDHHGSFYRTDHHWKAEIGLWASGQILNRLKDDYRCNVDADTVNPDYFTSVDYPEYFLGSRGRKVTLTLTKPDDFSLLYPMYQTDYHYEIPGIGVDLNGDYSILYDLTQVDSIDYYNKIPYDAHIYGDQALEIIENRKSNSDEHILFIHDSFGICVAPFLSLGVKRVDAIDLRSFSGSIQNYILAEKPSVVIVLYNPDGLKNDVLFDFR